MFKNVFGLGMLVCVSAVAQTGDVPVLTVCEALQDLQKFSGKAVIVVGASVGTMEGSWLRADCGFRVQNGEKSFDTQISTAFSPADYAPAPSLPPGFTWNRAFLQQKLDSIKRRTKRRKHERWAALYGRIETQLRSWKHGDTTYTLMGFGHLGAAPAELVSPDGSYLELK